MVTIVEMKSFVLKKKFFCTEMNLRDIRRKCSFTCFIVFKKYDFYSPSDDVQTRYYIHQTNTLECAFYTPFLLWKCVPFWSDLNHNSILSMVVKFQLCAPLFSKSTECNCQIFTGFYAYTKVKTIQWGFFLVSVFGNLTGKF